ncbi:hypothetical protein Godav_023925, partial [Gossypium davidsonii]|nr:hypothetical protein [Gossypium davidsonii]
FVKVLFTVDVDVLNLLFSLDRCIPFRYRSSNEADDVKFGKVVEGGWENDETVEEAAVREAIEEAGVRGDLMDFIGFYHFKSKTHQDEFSPEGLCKAAMFALFVKEELNSWPEQSTRTRNWLTIPKALQSCRHEWMKDALENGFCKWLAQNK